MPTKAAAATLFITVELDLRSTNPNVGPADLDAARGRLQAALQRNSLSATWAITDPASSASARSLVNLSPRQEVALLRDASWGAGGASDESLLTQRVERAREHGIRLQAFVLPAGGPAPRLEILKQHSLSAVRVSAANGLSARQGSDSKAENGTCVAPAGWRIGEVSGWWQQWKLVAEARRRMTAGELHLVLSTAQLAAASRQTWGLVEYLFAIAGERQKRGRLQGMTLGQLGEDHDRRNQVQPLRSILRAA